MTQTRTIYVSQTETRTFYVGEIVDFYVGEKSSKAQIMGFPGGLFQIRFKAGGPTEVLLGSLFVRALKPSRIPLEQLNGAW